MNIIDTNMSRHVKAINFVKNWKKKPDVPASSAKEDAIWHIKKISALIDNDERQCSAVLQLLNSRVTIDPRPKNLPSVERVYKLLKKDHTRTVNKYGKMIAFYKEVLNVINEMNLIERQFDLNQCLRNIQWLVYNRKAVEKVNDKLLNTNKEANRYIASRLEEMASAHTEFSIESNMLKQITDESLGCKSYMTRFSLFINAGFTATKHRPIFMILNIRSTDGDVMRYISNLPSSWNVLFIRLFDKSAEKERKGE